MQFMEVTQIVEQEAGKKMELALNEIGPRFVMKIVRIHSGSFSGPIIYENPNYENPSLVCLLCTILWARR